MKKELPLEINPLALSDEGATLQGELPMTQFKRLLELLESSEGTVKIEFKFGREEHGPRYLKGQLLATLSLLCRRCGRPLSYDINVRPCLSPVIHDLQAASLPKEYDPLVTGGKPVQLVDIVEEELLLSVPMFPKHRDGECSVLQIKN